MDRILQKLYDICGMIAGGLIISICLLISTQICLNLFGRIAPGVLPSTVPSYADFSGFMLAGATFLALAHTLRAGGHIRVNLVVSRMPVKLQFIAEGFALAIAAAFVGYATYYMVLLVKESIEFGDVSYGMVPVPLWIPQAVATFGIAMLFVALLHTLGDLVRAGKPILSTPDEV